MLSALRKIPALVRNSAVQSRNRYSYVLRPKEPLSIVETWAHGLVICAGIFAIPIWVLTHVKEYRGIDKKSE